MKIKYILILLIFQIKVHGQSYKDKQYLAETPPGVIPKELGSHLIAPDTTYVFGSVFTERGDEMFYAVRVDEEWNAELWHTQLKNGKWSTPRRIPMNKKYSYNDPFLSQDEKRLYFMSNYAPNDQPPKSGSDLWYIEKENDTWSDPKNLGHPINTNQNEFYISLSQNKALYFSSNRDTHSQSDYGIYVSRYKNGKYRTPRRLGEEINSNYFDVDPFIAPDESYLIFSSSRPGGEGKGDLYISFKTQKGTWTKAKNMGSKINTEEHEFCPFVSQDGKYLFFTRNGKIYWVSTKIIENLKNKKLNK